MSARDADGMCGIRAADCGDDAIARDVRLVRDVERAQAFADKLHRTCFLLRKLWMHVDVAAQRNDFVINAVDRNADLVGVHCRTS